MIKKNIEETQRKKELKEHILKQKEVYSKKLTEEIKAENELLEIQRKNLATVETGLIDKEHIISNLEKEHSYILMQQEKLETEISKTKEKRDALLKSVSEFKRDIGKDGQQVEVLERQKAQINQEILDLSNEKQSILEQVKRYEKLGPLSSKGLDEEKKTLESLKRTVQSLRADVKVKEERVIGLIEESNLVSSNMMELTVEFKDLVTKNESLIEDEKKTLSKISEIKNELILAKDNNQKEESKKEVFQRRIEKATELLKKAQLDIEQKEKMFSELSKKNRELELHEHSLINNILENKKKIENSEEKILRCEKSIESFKEKIFEKNEAIEVLAKKLSGLEVVESELNENLNKLDTVNSDLLAEYNALETQNKELKQAVALKTKQAKSAQKKQEQYLESINKMKFEIASTEENLIKTDLAITEEEKKLANAQEDFQLLEIKTQKLTKTYDDAQLKLNKIKEARESVKEQRDELRRLERQVNQKQSKLEIDLKRIVEKANDLLDESSKVSFKALRSFIHGSIDIEEKAVEFVNGNSLLNYELKKVLEIIISEEIYCQSLSLTYEKGQGILLLQGLFDSEKSVSDKFTKCGISNVKAAQGNLSISLGSTDQSKQKNLPS